MGDQLKRLIGAESLQAAVAYQCTQRTAQETLLALKIVNVSAASGINHLNRAIRLIDKSQHAYVLRALDDVVMLDGPTPAYPGHQCQTGKQKKREPESRG